MGGPRPLTHKQVKESFEFYFYQTSSSTFHAEGLNQKYTGVAEMAQHAKTSAAKPDDLNSIPESLHGKRREPALVGYSLTCTHVP